MTISKIIYGMLPNSVGQEFKLINLVRKIKSREIILVDFNSFNTTFKSL